MTRDEGFEVLIQAWLTAEAPTAQPPLLQENALESARRHRQRPGWLVDLRGGMVGAPVRTLWPFGPRYVVLFITLISLFAVIVVAVGTGAPPAPSITAALARPGLVGYAVDSVSEESFTAAHVMKADGTDERLIGLGSCPTWSSDGRVMAFAAAARPPSGGLRRPKLSVAEGDGASPRVVPGIEGVALSPDGTRIAWMHRTQGDESTQAELRVDPITGGSGTVLVPAGFSPDERYLSPMWSPDGRRLAFAGVTSVSGGWSYRSSIYIVDADGSGAHKVTSRQVNDEGEMSWSADGRSLAYTGLPDGVVASLDYRASDIFIIDIESGDERNATRSAADETDPRWSPDGSRLAFRTLVDSDGRLTTTEVLPSTSNAAPAFGPTAEAFAWSPDGSQLVVARQRAISVVSPDLEAAPLTVATTESAVVCVSWQPLTD